MQRKRHCTPLEDIGVTLAGMTPKISPVIVLVYIAALFGVAVLFLIQL